MTIHSQRTLVPIIRRPEAKRIGIIADTHIPDRSSGLHHAIFRYFKNVDLILHAGDISSPQVVEALGTMSEVITVRGNNRGDRRLFQPALPDRQIIEALNGYRIGLIHGVENVYQRVTDLIIGRAGFASRCSFRMVKRVDGLFDNVHCIVYGHAHWPLVYFNEKRLFVNPGKAFGRKRCTCGVMEIGKDKIDVRIVPIHSESENPLIHQSYSLS